METGGIGSTDKAAICPTRAPVTATEPTIRATIEPAPSSMPGCRISLAVRAMVPPSLAVMVVIAALCIRIAAPPLRSAAIAAAVS